MRPQRMLICTATFTLAASTSIWLSSSLLLSNSTLAVTDPIMMARTANVPVTHDHTHTHTHTHTQVSTVSTTWYCDLNASAKEVESSKCGGVSPDWGYHKFVSESLSRHFIFFSYSFSELLWVKAVKLCKTATRQLLYIRKKEGGGHRWRGVWKCRRGSRWSEDRTRCRDQTLGGFPPTWHWPYLRKKGEGEGEWTAGVYYWKQRKALYH